MLQNKTVLAHYLIMTLKGGGIDPDHDMHVEINGIIDDIDGALEKLQKKIDELDSRLNYAENGITWLEDSHQDLGKRPIR